MLLTPPAHIDLTDIVLRAWSAADVEALAAALVASDAHLRKWTPWAVDGRVPGVSLDDRLALHAADFAAGVEWVYGIFNPDGTEVLGGCRLYPRVGPRGVEIGYWLAAAHTGRGIATRAAAALSTVAFTSPVVDHVEMRVDRGNDASARIPERLGYSIMEPPPPDAPVDLQVWCLSREQFVRQGSREAYRRAHLVTPDSSTLVP